MLDAVGLSAVEERVYRLLVATPSASATELRDRLGCTHRQVTQALHRLETMGLVSRTPGRRPKYIAAPPDLAVEPLVLGAQLRLETVRAHAATLMETFRAARRHRDAGELLEVVVGLDPIAQRFEQLQRSARSEICALVTPPFLTDSDSDQHRVIALDQLARGVCYRTVYDHDGFEAQDGLAAMLADIAAGEQVRIAHRLPIKLFVVDRAMAFVPMTGGEPELRPGAVVVHRSGLLDGLVALFDHVWERAVPFAVAAQRDRPQGLDPDTARLLAMLHAGFTDAAIARHLGTSSRTVQRRIRELMKAECSISAICPMWSDSWRPRRGPRQRRSMRNSTGCRCASRRQSRSAGPTPGCSTMSVSGSATCAPFQTVRSCRLVWANFVRDLGGRSVCPRGRTPRAVHPPREQRVEVELERGRHAALIGELRRHADEHPPREAWLQLMIAQYRSGRQTEAVQTDQRLRRTLVDELGVEPGSSVRELHRQPLADLAGRDLAEPEPEPIDGDRAVVSPIKALVPADSPRLMGEDAEHGRALAEIGAELPPIVVHRPTMRIVDGMHRVKAAVRRGQSAISARFFDGSDIEAFVPGGQAEHRARVAAVAGRSEGRGGSHRRRPSRVVGPFHRRHRRAAPAPWG